MKVNEIFKVDYSKGCEHRDNIPNHALVYPFNKSTVRCFAFFKKTAKGNVPVTASFQPIKEGYEMSKNNYYIKLY